ncbi:ZYRO0B06644p [Zygosaccharomyces rouxii]|uniref:ZYRO0B06644p n=1 Tax=Zygosaccharomyces rouxii (strain ATCC 2623 / CBS 732 / NBRC 1130 / NCYC 568 / NRRL Y-229) TaxID=559307 RepID=C5DR97_ZYGRC|nr:uncharacterized protein ZYRO0B06644g [Zygosaccharomyces rouxii]KAH9200147.1 hypothetical protein LQ764DRAFT_113350 [Zygosaccharomyces rouxii]CAR26308.1 ZYRO0B06644p [Zygosaccharomyces rouxii]
MGQDEGEQSNKEARCENPDEDPQNETKTTTDESEGSQEQTEDGIGLQVEEGPFEKHTLIQNLLPDLEYSCFEAYDENIYLGTKNGDLLHYFEIERQNYMLVSRTKFNDESNKPIRKIILLPQIERALVLCDGILVVFLLPEFAPAPNTTKLKGVLDITLRNYSSQFKFYRFYAIKEESVKMLKISSQSISTAQNFDFKLISKASAIDYTLMTSKLNSYEIINLKDSAAIPLFPVSETDAPLKPIITKFGDNEFLVTTGGGSEDDNSIAFVVTSTGEISHGTIVLSRYPKDIVVEYPYVVVNLNSKQIEVFKLSPNAEPQVVQRMSLNNSDMGLCRSSKVFNNFEQTQTKGKVVEKLRLVPLYEGNHHFRIESEVAYINEIFEEETSLVVYGKFGIELLVKRSPILDFEQHGESEIDKLEDYLDETKSLTFSKLQLIERNYVITMLLLLIILHGKSVSEETAEGWCSRADRVDIKLLFYLLDLTIYGELWVCNGLTKLINQLKALNLINKCDDVVKLLKLIKNRVQNSKLRKSIKDYSNVIKMADVNILQRQLMEGGDNIDVDSFEENSLEDITTIVEEKSEDHLELLLSIYQRRSMFQELINLLKKKKDIKRIFQFLKKNATELPPRYKADNLADDLIFIINETPQPEKYLIREFLKILSSAEVDPGELLGKTGSNTKVKVFIIEEIGPRSSDDKEFLINFYMAKLQEALQEGNIWDVFAGFAAEYTRDMNYTKCSIAEFLLIKLRHNEHCQSFTECYQNVKNLCMQDEGDRLLRSVITQVKSFDVNHMLTILFIPEDEIKEEFLTRQDMFKAFLSFNDFLGIEKFINEDTILEVLRHYNTLPRGPDSLKLMVQLLKRNMYCVHDDGTLVALLREIPQEYSFKPLFEVIYSALRRIDNLKKELELQKALLKDENAINKTILTDISK